jgi:glycosyltransferase involved in cell wall biosynthesis
VQTFFCQRETLPCDDRRYLKSCFREIQFICRAISILICFPGASIVPGSIRTSGPDWQSAPFIGQTLRLPPAGRVQAIYHGFDHHAFTRNTDPLSPEVEGKLRASNADVTLLFVSHYNYYRNFETLIKAIPLLRSRLAGRSCRLLLTCQLEPGKNPGTYNPRKAAELIQKLGVRDLIVELGAIPYDQLHNLYDRADLYVTPAYTETFAHPLVEAMASGVPIIASDLEVHREICGDAAIYFPTFSPEKLAESIGQLVLTPGIAKQMSIRGMKRSQDFSWKQHVQEILKICETLLKRTSTRWDSAVQDLTK